MMIVNIGIGIIDETILRRCTCRKPTSRGYKTSACIRSGTLSVSGGSRSSGAPPVLLFVHISKTYVPVTVVDGSDIMDRHVSPTNMRKWTLVAVALILFVYVQMASSAPCCGGCGGCGGCTSSFGYSFFSSFPKITLSFKFLG
ncbi:uncharacterized protein LOC111030599 [Myzus persicae]|uniref:uncharacterized protein LOC111030599 n=1 Tax=Myzus persicae TaxID=13164 RepID=UPI000B937C97|nr:uncharacterized protein LOC111030599 [Myzus persicae]